MLITYIKPPERIPAQPSPAIARPTIKVGEFRARAHIKHPISKIVRDIRKIFLGMKMVISLPKNGRVAPTTRRKTAPYHPMSPPDLNSATRVGFIVATIVEFYGPSTRLLNARDKLRI